VLQRAVGEVQASGCFMMSTMHSGLAPYLRHLL
jgi:hypothetical protein